MRKRFCVRKRFYLSLFFLVRSVCAEIPVQTPPLSQSPSPSILERKFHLWGVKEDIPPQIVKKVLIDMTKAFETVLQDLDTLYAPYPQNTPLSHKQIHTLCAKGALMQKSFFEVFNSFRDMLKNRNDFPRDRNLHKKFLLFLEDKIPTCIGPYNPLTAPKKFGNLKRVPHPIEKLSENDLFLKPRRISLFKVFKAIVAYIDRVERHPDEESAAIAQLADVVEKNLTFPL